MTLEQHLTYLETMLKMEGNWSTETCRQVVESIHLKRGREQRQSLAVVYEVVTGKEVKDILYNASTDSFEVRYV